MNQDNAVAEALDGPVVLSREVFDFLMGAGELEGVSFGDLHDRLPGRFWWRAVLRAAERETPTIIAALKAQALRSQPSQPYAWLIERRVSPAQWSSERRPTGVGAFYSDPNRAHRFSTKEDAEEAMRNMAITPEERGQYFVSEHCWIDIPAQAQRVDEGGVS